MKLNEEWRIRLAPILLGGAILAALIVVRGIRAGDEPVHVTTDWSDRHVVFSSPKSLLQSLVSRAQPTLRAAVAAALRRAQGRLERLEGTSQQVGRSPAW